MLRTRALFGSIGHMALSSMILRESGLSRFQFLGGLLVLLFAIGTYCFSGFLLDDTLHLARIISSQGPGSLTYSIEPEKLDLHLLSGTQPIAFKYLRPLTSLSIRIDYLFFGPHPLGFHLVNTLLHLANVWLAFLLGRRLYLGAGRAWAAAVMWGVSVPAGLAAGWISGRSELLAAACILAAINAVLRHQDSGARRWLVVGSILLVLGSLAKESAIVGPALVLIFLWLVRDQKTAATVRRPIRPGVQFALWGPVIAGLVLRLVVIGPPHIPEPYFQPPDSPAAAYALLLKAVIYLLGGLSGLPVIPFIQIEVLQAHWIAPLLAALLAAAGLLTLFRFASGTKGLPLLAWFVVALIPALFVMAFSFYLYLPLLGLCWLFGLAWQKKRPLFIKSWMVWLTTAGVLINVTLGGCLVHLGHRAQAAQVFMEEILVAGRVEDVVFLDTPFWAYSLPVTVRLHDPSLSFHTHFLNFSPFLKPGTPSITNWASGREFEIATPDRRFFTSPIERFFLFGHDPCLDGGHGRAFSISCLGKSADNPYPAALRVTLDRSAADPGLILLQFDGWRIHRLLPPADLGSPAQPSQ